MRKHIRSLTAEGRLQGWTLVVLPFVVFAAMMVVNRAYAGGPYLRGAVNYTLRPNPPLAPKDLPWAAELVRALSPDPHVAEGPVAPDLSY